MSATYFPLFILFPNLLVPHFLSLLLCGLRSRSLSVSDPLFPLQYPSTTLLVAGGDPGVCAGRETRRRRWDVEMTRRCSHCNHDGHNSRTCPNRGVKLFGVRLDGSVRKSASMGNLSLLAGSSGGASPADGPEPGGGSAGDGYASEDFVKGSSSSCRDRKKEHGKKNSSFPGFHTLESVEETSCISCLDKILFTIIAHRSCQGWPALLLPGVSRSPQLVCCKVDAKLSEIGTPWTEEEHRMFLLGLQKLGKGDWRGISRNFVVSRTPTQVASHAQKYFIRKSNMTRRKRRSSLFDMVPDEVTPSLSLSLSLFDTQILLCLLALNSDKYNVHIKVPLEPQLFPMSLQESELQSNKPPPIPPTLNEECESMDSNDSMLGETVVPIPEAPQSTYTMVLPTYYPPFLQFASPYWPGGTSETPDQAHEIIKPTAVHSKSPINVEELVGMSKLSIGDNGGETVSLSSSLGLLSGSKRQSAFHANPFPKART
ncbi:hypothetical protein ZIOFF_047871 [Zingiber officinale]|uniref:Uncharacterized protein n=1 Tax=Zingiber officinale TaxID=94328 RepID=A0A8J5KLH9_ZINOF|nr:hypothetical protein ZIOFF_047871 [Zingiber officinale]